MPAPVALAAGISAAGSLGSSGLSNLGSRRAQKRANRANLFNWAIQNAYNHPSAQMSRLRDAGLNPNLIYGSSPQSASGNSSQIAPVKAEPYNVENPLRELNNIVGASRTSQQVDNLRTQNTVLTQDAILRTFQAQNEANKLPLTKAQGEIAKELTTTQLQALSADVKLREQQTIQAQLDNSFKSQALKDNVKRIFYEAQNLKMSLEGKKLDNQLKRLERDLKELGIEKNDPWYFRVLGRTFNQINE